VASASRNFYAESPLLRRLLAETLGPDRLARWEGRLEEYGALCAGPFDRSAHTADRFRPPLLLAWDAEANPLGEVLLDSSFRETLHASCRLGFIAQNYRDDLPGGRLPYTATYAMAYLLGHADTGARCILSLTGGTTLVLHRWGPPDLQARYLPGLLSVGEAPFLYGATFFTERQGGSDLGANTTLARREGNTWRLYGEKWFCSNVGADLALVTARPEGAPEGSRGLALFLLPRTLPDGRRNCYTVRRLKDKMGTRTVPTGEVVLEGAEAHLLAGPGEGIRRAMSAVNFSRLSVTMGALGMAHRALLEARAYARQRVAFGTRVADFPMVREALLGMASRLAGDLALAFLALSAFDRVHFYGEGDPVQMRFLAHLAKMRASDDSVSLALSAMQLIGGNAYVEDSPLPRLVRDACANPIWEGTGNIQAIQAVRLVLERDAHRPAMEDLKGALRRARAPALAPQRERVLEEAERVEGAVALLRGRDDLPPTHARHLADYLCDWLACARLLALAEEDPSLEPLARHATARDLAPGPRHDPAFWTAPSPGEAPEV